MNEKELKAFLFPSAWSWRDSGFWRDSGLDVAWSSFFKTFVRYCCQEGPMAREIGRQDLELAYEAVLKQFYDISYLAGRNNYVMALEFPDLLFLKKAAVVVIEQVLRHFSLENLDVLTERFSNVVAELDESTYTTVQESLIELEDELRFSSTPVASMLLSRMDKW